MQSIRPNPRPRLSTSIQVAALFVEGAGVYASRHGVDAWPIERDARTYAGPHPVVAHPPCNLWVNMAAQNYARATRPCQLPGCFALGCPLCHNTGRREYNRKVVLPAWYPGGNDGGCFAAALAAVRRYGGVLEHPAGSHAWAQYGIHTPRAPGWTRQFLGLPEWTCEVWQSAYGHKARKRTWLLYCGKRSPFELNWAREPGTHQIGWFDRNRPTLRKREASATPPAFARELIRLARWSRRG